MSDEEFKSVSIEQVNMEEELKTSYLAYSMSVIVGRALPDVRDGLKPVHRRILYAMNGIGCDKTTKKSARIVGDVIGKYHPHGDSAAYDALVRLAQPFNMRYCLVDGQGNFGNEDGDPAAAQRYTEAKLAKISAHILCDLDKDTVDMVDNFDNTEKEPSVLATKIPLLLVNGSNGIAVGMATNIPPHNLTEICDGMLHLLKNPDCNTRDLMQFVKGPDFPTCGFIHGKRGIYDAYDTGRGKIQVRARVDEEVVHGHNTLVVKELPYQVNKKQLVEKIAELVKTKAIDGITGLRDLSGRNGIRIEINLRKDVSPQIVLNNLFKQSQLQSTFGIIMLAIVNNKPMVLSLKEVMNYFLDFRRDVIVRRTIFLLRKARERAHILEGYKKALENIDRVIEIIRGASDVAQAKESLIAEFEFSDVQAKSILDLRLQRLTNMERTKILEELAQLMQEIQNYELILNSKDKIDELIASELEEVKKLYGDKRRTEIIDSENEFETEDFIADEYCMVIRTRQNYIKRQLLSEYQAQKRGGQGKLGMGTKDDDDVRDMFIASAHQRILIFTTLGRVFLIKVYELPQGTRTTKGKPIVNLLQKLDKDENVETILPLPKGDPHGAILMATQNGLIKKTQCEEFKNVRKVGIRALSFKGDDRLISAKLVENDDTALLLTANGNAIHFKTDESDLRSVGRSAKGVIGIKLKDDDRVVSMVVSHSPEDILLTVTENGYGKRTPVSAYTIHRRSGLGMKAIATTERNGCIVDACIVEDDEHLILATDSGKVIRTRANEVRICGRTAAGVKLMNIGTDERVVAIAAIDAPDDDNEETTVERPVAADADAQGDLTEQILTDENDLS